MYRLTDVTKTYKQGKREVRALDDVTLEIADGDYVAIQGQTGGGKSTLLQMLGALDKPTSGAVELGNRNLAKLGGNALGQVRATEIGFVFQSFNLIPTLSAQENVETALAPLGVSAGPSPFRGKAARGSVGGGGSRAQPPEGLSRRQEQRAG